MTLATYQDKFRRLKVNVSAGRASPHKICMLLALLDLARSGGLADNRILFAPPLLERYQRFFAAVRTPGDHPNPYFPFFHLAGKLRGGEAGFWHLQPLHGRATALGALSTARSLRDITDNIACATLDPELFELLQQPESLEALADTPCAKARVAGVAAGAAAPARQLIHAPEKRPARLPAAARTSVLRPTSQYRWHAPATAPGSRSRAP